MRIPESDIRAALGALADMPVWVAAGLLREAASRSTHAELVKYLAPRVSNDAQEGRVADARSDGYAFGHIAGVDVGHADCLDCGHPVGCLKGAACRWCADRSAHRVTRAELRKARAAVRRAQKKKSAA